MNKYLILRRGYIGCDHSIACGKDYTIELSELSLEDFIKASVYKSFFGESDADPSDYDLGVVDFPDELIIVELNDAVFHEQDMSGWLSKFRTAEKDKAKSEQEEQEKQLLVELLQKHGLPEGISGLGD